MQIHRDFGKNSSLISEIISQIFLIGQNALKNFEKF